MKKRTKNNLTFWEISVCCLLLFGGFSIFAVEPEQRTQFLKISEIIRLINMAHNAGYDYQAIETIQFRDEYVSFKVKAIEAAMKYIEEHLGFLNESFTTLSLKVKEGEVVDLLEFLKKSQLEQKDSDEDKEEGRYFSPQDVVHYLIKDEPDQIIKMREKYDNTL